jgi:type VI secretion system protein ImpJ
VFHERNRFHLVLTTESGTGQLVESVLRIAKLSTREYLPILITQALNGVRLEHLPTPPQELPRKIDAAYFRIDHHAGPWQEVILKNNLALYWDSAPEDLRVELIVIRRE